MAMASSSFDMLNVIYCSHMLILLVYLLQIYVHSSPYISLIIRNALKYNNDGNFLQKSSAEMTKIADIFYVNATWVCKTQFHWSSWMEWPGINQLAAIFLRPCTLAYDVIPFCVDANMTTGEVVCHLLINFPVLDQRWVLNVCQTVSAPYSLRSRYDVNSYQRSLLDARLFNRSHNIML